MLFSGAAVVGSGFSAILIFKVKPRPTDGRVQYQLLPLTDLQKIWQWLVTFLVIH